MKRGNSRVNLKQRSQQLRLSDNAHQRAACDWIVERNWNGKRCGLQVLLHDPVTSALSDCGKSVFLENSTNLPARKNS